MKGVLETLGSLALGMVVGSLAAVFHSAAFPMGLVAGIALLVVFVTSLRILGHSRALAAAGSLGAVGSIVFLAGIDDAGSVIIMADSPGIAFLVGATVAVTLGLAWPKVSSRKTGYDEVPSVPERNTLS